MPKAPRPAPPPPTTPTRASFISRGKVKQTSFGSQKQIRPITGTSRSHVGRPTLLGGF